MLGPFLPNYRLVLVARSAFERLALITKVGSPFFYAWPTRLGGWLGPISISATLRGPHCGGSAGFHVFRTLDNDIRAGHRDGVVLDVYFSRALH